MTGRRLLDDGAGSSSSAISAIALETDERGADIETGTPRFTAIGTSRSYGISPIAFMSRAFSTSDCLSSTRGCGRFRMKPIRSVG